MQSYLSNNAILTYKLLDAIRNGSWAGVFGEDAVNDYLDGKG
jgi:hypothetical protein